MVAIKMTDCARVADPLESMVDLREKVEAFLEVQKKNTISNGGSTAFRIVGDGKATFDFIKLFSISSALESTWILIGLVKTYMILKGIYLLEHIRIYPFTFLYLRYHMFEQ